MDTRPLVSVVIPTHNRPQTLKAAILSALRQDFNDLEVVVVGNGSGPETEQAVAGLAPEKVRFVWHPQNLTVGAARNVGIRASRGKYIAFLDDDDLWMPQKLLKQVPYLEDGHADVVYSTATVQTLTPTGPIEGPQALGEPLRAPEFLYLLRDCVIPSLTAVVRKEAINQVGFLNESRRFLGLDDYELWLRIALFRYRFRFIDEPLAVYRLHQGQYHGLRTPALKSLRAQAQVLRQYRRQVEAYSRFVAETAPGDFEDPDYIVLGNLRNSMQRSLDARQRRSALVLWLTVMSECPRLLCRYWSFGILARFMLPGTVAQGIRAIIKRSNGRRE